MNANFFMTAYDGTKAVSQKQQMTFKPDSHNQELRIINIYPEVQYQEVSYFGGAITDSVGSVLERMLPERAHEVIESYFGSEGIGYRAIRTHIDSCDFSTDRYIALADPEDRQFTSFSLQRDEKRIIPWIKAAYASAKEELPVMLSPWSPLAYMKTNGDRTGGGHLKMEFYSLWSKYICRYIQEYRDRGINVHSISVQNEPNAAQTWESCLFTAEEERRFLEHSLYPQLVRSGLSDIEVYIWDHNKERLFDRANAEINEQTKHMISGLAFHWYSGDHFDALRLVREKFPDKKLLFSEGCIEYSLYDKDQLKNANRYSHDMIGNFRSGMNGFLDWNIVLDEKGGPNHVGNFCEAPIVYDERRGLDYKLSFFHISHFSKYIHPHAKRIATTNYSEEVESVAFQNSDGKYVIILLNRNDRKQSAFIRLFNQLLEVELDSHSIATVEICN